jgi:hypothetical protein
MQNKLDDTLTDCLRNYEIAKSRNLIVPLRHKGQMDSKAFFHNVTSNEFWQS